MTISVAFEILNRASAPLGNIKKMFSDVGATVDRVTDRMMKMNQTVEMIDKMGAAAERITQPYREFEQSMAGLSSITGIMGEDLERLGKIARQSGVDSGLGAKGAVDAFALLASQIQVDDIGMDGLIELQKQTITLSQAAGMSMTDAANSMAGTINQFGLQASEANRVINVLAAGSKYGAAEITQLSESFKVTGAACAAAGLSVEQTAGALEVLSKNNLKGAEAGTALRNIMLKMQTALGVDFNKTSLSEALTKLKPKMKDATYMAKIFGMENIAAAQFLIKNADAVDTMTQKVTGTQVATEQAAINTDTWNHRLEVQAARLNEWGMRLAENGKGILNVIQVGSQFSSMFLAFTPLISAAGSALAIVGKLSLNAVKGIYRLATSSKAAAAGVWLKNAAIATGNGILTVYNALTSRAWWTTMAHTVATKASALWTAICSKTQLAASVITSLWSKRTALATLVQGGLTKALRLAKVTMLTGVIPALTGVIASTWAWTVALLANPLTWIILGIVALVAAIAICWEKFAGFRAVIYTIWDTIKGFGQAIVDWVIAPFKAAGSLISGLAGAVGKVFSGDWGGAWDSVKEGFSGAADAFTKPVKEAVDTAKGISGNYQMHLTEERAKQAEKEKTREAKKQEAPTGAGFDLGGIDLTGLQTQPTSMDGFDMKGLEAQLGGMQVAGIDLTGMDAAMVSGADSPAATPEITGYSAPQQMPTLSRDGLLASAGKLQNNPTKTQATEISTDALSGMMTQVAAQGQSAAAPAQIVAGTTVQVDFKPTINISGNMSKKSKDEVLALFRQFAGELTKMVNEENRKQNRGNYGIPAIG